MQCRIKVFAMECLFDIVRGVRKKPSSLSLALTISSLFVAGCDKKFDSHFPTAAAASQAGEFTRGWLPDILQPDATDIHEWHDLDSNRCEGQFSLNDNLVRRVQKECKSTREVPMNATEFRCGDFLVSLDLEKRTGNFQSNGR